MKLSFKPYYNWNTFNTYGMMEIQMSGDLSFKPYYNWNTFNTIKGVALIKHNNKF